MGQIWVCWILICHKCFTFVTVYPIWITVTPLYSKNKTYDTNILLEIRLECVLESNTKIIKYMRGVSLELIHLNKNYLNHNSLMKVPEVRLVFWIFSNSLYKNKIKKTILSVTKIEISLEIIYINIITYINKIIYICQKIKYQLDFVDQSNQADDHVTTIRQCSVYQCLPPVNLGQIFRSS